MGSYSIKNLSFSYPEEEDLVLNKINLEIKEGEFVVLCGPSGCGKTTLLRQLKTTMSPHGSRTGEIYFKDKLLDEMNQREQASHIGYVMQSPDNQIVTDKVWHELAFGLESLGYDTATIRLRVSEMASFFGIQNWFYKDVRELSGGQKQLLNLAGIMAMQPSVLILDEPTSQLDPIAASDFLATISKINREIGTTIILTEHRLDEAMPLADRAVVMDRGKIIGDGEPTLVGEKLAKDNHKMFLAMPVPMRIYAGVENKLSCPITVREGRVWFDEMLENNQRLRLENRSVKEEVKENRIKSLRSEINKLRGEDIDENSSIVLRDVWFKYEKDLPDVVKGLSFHVQKGEFYSILGGNGTGKTTSLSLVAGINTPYRGKIYIEGQEACKISDEEKFGGIIGVLPQNPQAIFVKSRVLDDLYEILKGRKLSRGQRDMKVKRVVALCDLENLLNRHPYDLSGGEQQRAALAKVLLLEPKILLLDEPTKGLDAQFKMQFAAILRELLNSQVSILMISHDIEFCAKYSDRCALFFDGSIVTEAESGEFFSGNSFYTTAANRMVRHKLTKAVTPEDVILSLGGQVVEDVKLDFNEADYKLDEKILDSKKKPNYLKFILGIISFIGLVFTFIKAYPVISDFTWAGLSGKPSKLDLGSSYEKWRFTFIMLGLVINSIVFFLSVFDRGDKIPKSSIQVDRKDRKLSKRTLLASFLILILIPFTIFFGVYYLGDKKYYFISLLIIIEVMAPFLMIFESRKPQAREIVIISVLCAIGVAGRAAFFMIPQFKPVAALAIIAGVAFGAESGFMVGAITMFLSNIIYSQGPWTPWQMFVMGIIGFLAGILFRKGFLRRDRLSLATYGGISVFLIYGGIMNPASVIIFQSKVNWKMIVTAWVTGVPFDLIHAAATVFFIIVMGDSMLEKLDRIKVKYGLAERN